MVYILLPIELLLQCVVSMLRKYISITKTMEEVYLPGVGNQGSGCAGDTLRHGNEGLLYLGVDLGVSGQREEVTSVSSHLACCSQELGPVLRERERERERERDMRLDEIFLNMV